ncbi:MAG: cell entry protein [Candidatus Binatus sp.]|nr:cell entry protein [Candidatus Binatus sp.]
MIASKAGSPNNPAWYHNLVANPEGTVELGNESYKAKAIVTKGEERQKLFNAQARQMPVFFDYQKKTTRQIPVIALERIK